MQAAELKRLGLSTNESRIYLVLLELGQAQAGEISKKTQINRTTTYDAIERLIKKGLVSYVIQANKKSFKPTSPNKFIENLKEQERFVEKILPELNSLYKSSKEAEETNTYKGRKGIKSILQDILKCKEYVAFGSAGKFLDIMKHDFIIFQKRKKELRIKSRVILNESSRKTETVKLAYTNFKFIQDEYSVPTTTFVYNNQVAIIIWAEIPVATVIKSKDVAESYKNYFELLWKQAKP